MAILTTLRALLCRFILQWARDEDSSDAYMSYTLSAKYIGDEGYVVRSLQWMSSLYR